MSSLQLKDRCTLFQVCVTTYPCIRGFVVLQRCPSYKSYSPDIRKHTCVVQTPAKITSLSFLDFFSVKIFQNTIPIKIRTHCNDNICQNNCNYLFNSSFYCILVSPKRSRGTITTTKDCSNVHSAM